MESLIQYRLLRKAENMDAVIGELLARGLECPVGRGWKFTMKMLKDNENDKNATGHQRYFVPTTLYAIFCIKGNDA